MPVYEGTLDNLTGYVNVKDILAILLRGEPLALQRVMRPGYFVAATMRAVDLMNEMTRKRTPLAIVVDETGTMSGIVTMEDLLEELVGELFNEHDISAPESIRAEADGSFLIEGQAPVREVNRALDVDLPDGESWSTIAGLCIEDRKSVV